jgi:RimJ/RimL family protein N-acetyltransferase
VIEEKETGRFAGEMGFADFKREIDPPLSGMAELGWALASEVHGKGYATDAVRLALDWAAVHLAGMPRVCLIHPENAASIRVALKCGFREYRRTTYKGQPAILFID